MKKFAIAVGVLLVLLVGAVVLMVTQLDRLVKVAVEQGGSQAAQVQVSLSEVDIKPREGSAALRGLVVANPPGFSTDYAMSLGGISVVLDPANVSKELIVIREVAIDAPAVTYELGAEGSNIKRIQQNVERFAASGAPAGGEEAAAPQPQPETAASGPKLIIDNLYLRGGQVTVHAPVLQGEPKTAVLPDVHLRDLGRSEGGLSGAELSARILAAINKATAKAVSDMQIDGLKSDLAGMLDEQEGALRSKLKEAGEKLKGFFNRD